jgi:drug/metabolite transporter (DMT)-like permease
MDRFLRRVGSVLYWAGALVLAAFGIVFAFANYPLVAVGIVLVLLAVIGYADRQRRVKQRESERARRRARARTGDLSSG